MRDAKSNLTTTTIKQEGSEPPLFLTSSLLQLHSTNFPFLEFNTLQTRTTSEESKMSALGCLLSLFLFLFSCSTQVELAHAVAAGNWTGAEMVPLIEEGKGVMMVNESRRRLGSFQICALCTCCGSGGAKGYCVPSPCCYAINCNIPNRPFGFCAFTPKTCNCFGCHL